MIDFLLPPENERQSCLAGPADRDEWHQKKEENNSMNNVPPVFKVQHTFSVWEVLVIKKFNPYNKKEDQVS